MPRPADRLPPPPPSLGRVRGAELTTLTERAVRRQQHELVKAIDRAFDHVPPPLRGAMRKALGA